MKNQSGCAKWGLALGLFFGLLALVLAAAVIFLVYLPNRQEAARARYAPPLVSITAPEDGLQAAAGSYLPLAGTIFFSPQAPVENIEWWLDGTRLESQFIQAGAGETVFYAHYDLLVPTEGRHLLFLRAVNSLGVAGNSQPITFESTPKGEAYYNMTLTEGETLENLAANYGTDAATLQALNPGLGSAPAAGTSLKVPVPPEDEPAAPAQTPAESVTTLVPIAPMLKAVENPASFLSFFAVKPPDAPTDLQGEVKDCKVKLIWQDNAANESGYEVWMAAGGSALTKLAKLQPASGGAAWFEFQAPGPGYWLFWVEAVNSIGAQGSNIISLNVDAGCPAGAPTHLQAEILDMTVSAAAERVYCYVSFENTSEVRLPAMDGDFIAVQNGHGDLAPWPHIFAVPFPQDGTLDLSGECWGWAGNHLSKLGNFNVGAGSETWNGSPILAHSSAFDVSLSLKSASQSMSEMRYISSNSSAGVPYNLRLVREEDPNWSGCEHGCWALEWDFDIEPGKTAADYYFRLFWRSKKSNDAPRELGHGTPGYSRAQVIDYTGTQEALIKLFGCNTHVIFEVTTGLDVGLGPTGYLTYKLPQCPASLTVTFDTLELPWTGDGWNAGPCDHIDVYYTLMVNDQKKSFWGGCSFGVGCFLQPVQCGTYTFKQLASPTSDPYPDQITVPAYDEAVFLKIVTLFYDHDWGSGDDIFAPYIIEHQWPTRAAAEAELGCNGKSYVTDKYVNDTADSILHYTISILPNPCQPYQP